MAKRIVRLTESHLTKLIGRIIEQVEDEVMEPENDLDFENEDDFENEELTKDEVVDLISDFFKDEVLPELSPREEKILKNKVNREDTSRIREQKEGRRGFGDRMRGLRDNAMIGVGVATAGVGAVASLGEFMGWSEFELTQKIHEFVEQAGMGMYSGPITVSMVAAGLAMALRGVANKYNRKEM
jgi:hypothetical protein